MFNNRFKTGDEVTWRNDKYANMTNRLGGHGVGPFVVTRVSNVNGDTSAVGHTQFVYVTGGGMKDEIFSGAFFRVLVPE